MLSDLGWRAGEPWLQEITVPGSLDWSLTGLATTRTVAEWEALGVAARTGTLGPADLPASVLLPMGRHGPTFLAYPNFSVFFEWNKSFVYVTTAAYFATRLEGAPVYAAGGYYYPDDSHGRLQDEMRHYADLGYRAFKMKIGGASLAEDMGRIEAALKVIGDPGQLAVDANGRFDSETAIAYADAMSDFGLRWFEEPGDPLDYRLMHDLAAVYEKPLATGENLFSCRDVDNLIRQGGLRPGRDLFQMDPALSYGLGEFGSMIAAMEAAGYGRGQLFPHGGHMIALHIVVGLGLGGSEAYPGVFAPVGGYAPDCIVDEGGISPGPAPGFDLELGMT